jgi:hypothetical protein
MTRHLIVHDHEAEETRWIIVPVTDETLAAPSYDEAKALKEKLEAGDAR